MGGNVSEKEIACRRSFGKEPSRNRGTASVKPLRQETAWPNVRTGKGTSVMRQAE